MPQCYLGVVVVAGGGTEVFVDGGGTLVFVTGGGCDGGSCGCGCGGDETVLVIGGRGTGCGTAFGSEVVSVGTVPVVSSAIGFPN